MLRSTPPPRWLWIGNSNTKPFTTHFDNEFRKFALCTKAEQFKGQIERAPDICDHLTLSGIDTLVADFGNAAEKNAEEIEVELDKIFSMLEGFRQQGLKIVVEPLLPWKRHPDQLRRAAISAFKDIKTKYPGISFPPKPDSLKFVADGVHLTDRAGSKLFKLMYEHSIAFFEKQEDTYLSGIDSEPETEENSDVTLNSEEEIEVVGTGTNPTRIRQPNKANTQKNPKSGTSKGKKFFTPKQKPAKNPPTVDLRDDDEDEGNVYSLGHPDFKKLMKDFTTLKAKVEQRWTLDLLVSAGTKEDLDKIENEKNMNKVVFNGIEIHDLWAADLTWAERLERIKKAIAEFIKVIDHEGVYELGYIRHLNFKLKAARQILEVTMGSESQARNLRKAFGAKVKAWRESKSFPDEVKGHSIGPALTLATRVRIAILHALAKEIKSNIEDTDSWVIQHVSRPVLKIETTLKDETKSTTTLGFAQAMAHYQQELPHANLSTQDLYDAYSIAGIRFGRELRHYFVILDEGKARTMAINRKPRMNKKHLSTK